MLTLTLPFDCNYKWSYKYAVRIEWDPLKNAMNIQKHGFDFEDAWEVFENPLLVKSDARKDYGEQRWIGIGVMRTHPVVVVIVFTIREPDIIRMISMRKAGKEERKGYEEAIKDRLGTY